MEDAKALEIAGAAARLCGYAATARKGNTDDWMHGFARHINSTLRALGDPDRVFYDNTGGITVRREDDKP